ncbi:hypothetical protein IQ241_20235 [Romeria aff. gracilis LEGE 07310]|uniref:Uncharacterized protein n=1 Tax=Vasconcelosia minhoensis LEGE 07310 TaxID=915328 RepID=A0A8J7DD70_9CYAN|nr:hypothetical protein [Romeria gracilis]MBE9079597.1 hypothetical protein [Romeria aff. gracilis LEGE 07310]
MIPIKRQIVTDEAMQPVAVIISYADWQQIEALLQAEPSKDNSQRLASYAGSITLSLDPLTYQKQIRDEWN